LIKILKRYIYILFFLSNTACIYYTESDDTAQYFDKKTKKIFLEALNYYKRGDFKIADSLFTIVISNSHDKLTVDMPRLFNPYYFRGLLSYEHNMFYRALSDLEHVSINNTSDTTIFIIQATSFQMVAKYDTAIALYNKLLKLKVDSAIMLSERGSCYFKKGDLDKACQDLKLSKMLRIVSDTSLNHKLDSCK
jgi:tetratricopeptide (TPR) repeat protein